MHCTESELVPYVLRNWGREALLPAARLSFSRHPPPLIPVGVHLVENAESSRLFLPPHALEARLRNRSSYDFLSEIQTSPFRDLFSDSAMRSSRTGTLRWLTSGRRRSGGGGNNRLVDAMASDCLESCDY